MIALSIRALMLTAFLATPLAAVAQPAPVLAPVSVEQAWARATPGQSNVGALYLTLRAATADRLASLSTPVSGMAMLHETRDVGGTMQMRDLTGLALPAGERVAMRPGGVHVMLMDLSHPLKLGEHFPVTLMFDHAPPVTVEVTVARAGASAP